MKQTQATAPKAATDRNKEVQASQSVSSSSRQSVSQRQQQQQESTMKQTRAKKFKPVIKKETCYPHLIPLSKWLAHREGEEGMRKLGKAGLAKLEEYFRARNRDV